MLSKTDAIVLKTIKYSDSKLIAKIYTRELGLKTFFIPVSRSSKSKLKQALLQNLTQLSIECESRENKQFATLKEISCNYHYLDLTLNVLKSSIASFLNEVILNCIKEEEKNETIFDFITFSFQWLDNAEEYYTNFHLYFLIELTRHLGFYPQNNYSTALIYFDLQNGAFCETSPIHANYLIGENARLISDLLMLDVKNLRLYNISKQERDQLVNNLILFYRLHISGFKELKSLQVLRETFNG
jgi:DNA repair protein RecO (recombination protein O)